MAHLHVDFFSQALQVGSSLEVILPEAAPGAIGVEMTRPSDPPVLYLLHGLSDDHTIWMRRTSIERYAAEYGLAVVMPGVGRSFYTDMVTGLAYWTYVSEEVPAFVQQMFRVGSGRSKTLVAGLSMGGYGAMKLAFTYPERFAAAGSFSGAVDMASRVEALAQRVETAEAARPDAPHQKQQPQEQQPQEGDHQRLLEYRAIFGDSLRVRGTGHDTMHLAGQAVGSGAELPSIYLACGTEDFLFEDNQRFDELLHELGAEHTAITEPGTHEWGFWDRHVAKYLAWLREKRLL